MRFSTHSRLGLSLLLLLVLATGLVLYTSSRGVAQAANPHVWLSQTIGPPAANVQVHGYGFGVHETVLAYFDDTTQIGSTTTDATGKFVVRMIVPKSALPGTHSVRATGQNSGLMAKALFLVRTDWAQLGFGPHHTGYNPYENVLTSSNVSNLALDWSYPATGGYAGISSSPAVANGLVYIDSDKLYALDAVTGALKWSFNNSGSISSPAVANGVVYVVPIACSNLVALDAMTGTLKWSSSTGTPLETDSCPSPTVSNGVVYVSSDKLYALNALTGTLEWSYSTGNVYYFATSPAGAKGVVYVGSYDDNLYALDALTGALKWSYPTGGTYSTSLAIANGVIYFGSDNLYALDAVTGTLKWSYSTGNRYLSSPTVANGVVYFGSLNVYAFHLPGMS